MIFPKPSIQASFLFSQDYQQESFEGSYQKSEELAIFLPTLIRSVSNCGDILVLGEFKGFTCWGGGKGMRILTNEEQTQLEILENAFDPYAILSPALVAETTTFVPVMGALQQLLGALSELQSVHWYGYRDGENNEWEQALKVRNIEPQAIQKATMMVLQSDILLKGHELPRSRVKMTFTEGSFWLWSTADDDYLMAIQGPSSDSETSKLLKTGEAFLLLS